MKPKTKNTTNKESASNERINSKVGQINCSNKISKQLPLYKKDSNTSQKQLANIINNNTKTTPLTSSSSKQQQQQQASSKRIKSENKLIDHQTNNNNKFNCSGCNKPIVKDKFLLKACEKYWHENCLKCDHCNGRLGELGSTLYCKSDMKLCRHDYFKLFGKTGFCSVCEKLITATEMAMKAKQNVYHLECFACQLCNQRFCVGDRFYLCENKVVCQYDYEEHILPIQRSLYDQQQQLYYSQQQQLDNPTSNELNNQLIESCRGGQSNITTIQNNPATAASVEHEHENMCNSINELVNLKSNNTNLIIAQQQNVVDNLTAQKILFNSINNIGEKITLSSSNKMDNDNCCSFRDFLEKEDDETILTFKGRPSVDDDDDDEVEKSNDCGESDFVKDNELKDDYYSLDRRKENNNSTLAIAAGCSNNDNNANNKRASWIKIESKDGEEEEEEEVAVGQEEGVKVAKTTTQQ